MTNLETFLSIRDIAELQAAHPTLGVQNIPFETYTKLREATTCEVVEKNGAGSGRWAIKLSRTSPKLSWDGIVGEPETTEFEWQIIDEKGGRLDYEITTANIERKSMGEAFAARDWKRVAAGWRAIARRWQDPLLAVDVYAAESLQTRMEYGDQVVSTFLEAGDGLVRASLKNGGDKDVAVALVHGVFQTADGEQRVPVEVGPIAAGATIEYFVQIPDEAEGSVKLHTMDIAFPDAGPELAEEPKAP